MNNFQRRSVVFGAAILSMISLFLFVKDIRAEDAEGWNVIKKWDFVSEEDIRTAGILRKNGADAVISFDKDANFTNGNGALKYTIIAEPSEKTPCHLRLIFDPKSGVEEGKEYRLSFWHKSSKSVDVETWIMMKDSPWTLIPPVRIVKSDENWQKCEIFFKAPGNISEIYCPQFWFGALDKDTVIWIGEVEFAEKMK